MRPTARRQSALRTPLNDILATEANVRILRALTDARSPINPGELARRTLLQRSTVHRALEALTRTGVVRHVGTGPRSQVELSSTHPLAQAIGALFTAETVRTESLVSELHSAAIALRPPPRAVWLDGQVATSTDKPGEPVLVWVLDGAATLARATEGLRTAVGELERRLDVTIEVHGMTPADLDAMPPEARDRFREAQSLLGLPPEALIGMHRDQWRSRKIHSHADHDTRALALASAVADKLARDPSLIARAEREIARRLPRASPRERKELEEWDHLLRTASPARLRAFLVHPGERATRLRQTLPFLGILTSAEREGVLGRASPRASASLTAAPRGQSASSNRGRR